MGDSWGWGGLSARRGLGLQTREGGGLETHRVAAKMSGEVHGEGWQLLVPLAAPPPYTYSCLLMSVRLQMAQLRGQLWP